MKSLKNILAIVALFAAVPTFAQSETDTTLIVNGVCEMCQKNIENACNLEGVNNASWSPETKVLTLSFDADVISLEEINTSVTEAGYDTEISMASDEAYEAIHGCCKYRDPSIHEAHNE